MLCVREAIGLYVGWLCEVVVADRRCSTLTRLLLTTFMTHFRLWQVHMYMDMYLHLSMCVKTGS